MCLAYFLSAITGTSGQFRLSRINSGKYRIRMTTIIYDSFLASHTMLLQRELNCHI